MQNELQELLDTAKELLKNELTEIAFNTWIVPLDIESRIGNEIILSVENEFFKDTIMSKHLPLIKNTFNFITKQNCDVSIIVKGDTKTPTDNIQYTQTFDTIPTKDINIKRNNSSQNLLNPKYTFESYIVGNNNRFAHAAALAVAESPATLYNPLFLYGGVGLGKTHLMHAIGNELLKKNSYLNVLYVTSERFTNDFINGLQEKKIDSFRNKYRNIDVLLIDDIQFIIGKDRSQEEFFHTFNTLHEAKKQIIISSDKPPKDFDTLEERLKSRFEWGLTVDISPPDYETRMAILRKKAEIENYKINDEIFQYIATNIKSNIRELEGAITKVVAFSRLSPEREVNVEFATEVLKDIISPTEQKEITPKLIIQIVSEHFGLQETDIYSKKRSQDIVYPRQIAMYLCRQFTEISLVNIGKAFGKRDHSTVLHAIEKIEAEVETNNSTRNTVDILKKKINPN